MIVVRLNGGLGNQMFQYSLGRNIAKQKGVPLKLDISGYKNGDLRQFGLSHFAISSEIATDNEIFTLKGSTIPDKIKNIERFKWLFKPYNKRTYIEYKSMRFNPSIFNVGNEVYLDGYWQSEKYFKEIRPLLKREFNLKEEPDKINIGLAEKIMDVNSASIHVRRGDYILNPKANLYHGVCPISYFNNAISFLLKTQQDLEFFIFSDDTQWVRDNLKIKLPVHYMEHNGSTNDYLDMWLMSQCKHHIISNSSFSWWGAWLGDYQKKNVIAPAKWFNFNIDTSDLIPDDWVRIKF
jgi:hypothetical protein